MSNKQLEEVRLSTACLAFGVVSVLLSFVGVGAILGFAGLVNSRKYQDRGFEINQTVHWGHILSTIGLVAGLAFSAIHVQNFLRGPQEDPLKVWEGVPAPEFKMRLVDGNVVRLSDFEGRRVALVLWATWCQPCLREIPILSRLHKETSRNDLEIIGVSAEDPELVGKFVKRHGIGYPVTTPAQELPRPIIDVAGIPQTFVIDRNGIIQFVAGGLHSYEELKGMLVTDDYAGEIKAAPPEPGSEPPASKN